MVLAHYTPWRHRAPLARADDISGQGVLTATGPDLDGPATAGVHPARRQGGESSELPRLSERPMQGKQT